MKDLIRHFNGIGRPRVLLIGDLMLDEFIYGDVERISPEAPVPVLRVVKREHRLGGAGNVANALATLGAVVQPVGVVGDGHTGEQLRNLLAECGVEHDLVLTTDDRPTIVKSRFVGLAQHRHAQQILRVDDEQVKPLSDELQQRVHDTVMNNLATAEVLAVEDYGKGLLDPAALPTWIAEAVERGATVVVDPYPTDDYSRYRGASIITPNRFEAELASGVKIDSFDNAQQAAENLLAVTQGDAVVITLDKQGAYVLQDGQPGVHVPTRPRTVYDVTGAGDVVMATLSLAVASGVPLCEAVSLANVAGGLEVERFGVQPITREEILEELQSHSGDYDE